MKRSSKKAAEISRRDFLAGSGALLSLRTASPLLYTFMQHSKAMAEGAPPQMPVFTLFLSGGAAGSRMGPAPRRSTGTDNNTIVSNTLWQSKYAISSTSSSANGGLFTDFGPAYFYKGPNVAGNPTVANDFLGAWLAEIDKHGTTQEIADLKASILSTGIANVTGNDNTPGCPAGIAGFIGRMWSLASRKPLAAGVLGNVNTVSGNGSGSIFTDPFTVRVTTGSQVKNQLKVGAFCQPLATAGATDSQFAKLAERLEHYMGVKLAGLSDGNLDKVFKQIQSGAVSDLKNRVIPAAALSETSLNPAIDAGIRSILGITATATAFADSNNDEDKIRTMILGGFRGAYPVVSIGLGGYDYHDTAIDRSAASEAKAGKYIGWICRMSAYLGIPALILVQSDGSVSSTGIMRHSANTATDSSWSGDDGSYGCWNMTLVRSGWASTKNHLINYIGETSNTSGKIVAGGFLGSVGREASAIMAWNYANLVGLQTEFGKVMTLAGFPDNVTNQIKNTRTCFG